MNYKAKYYKYKLKYLNAKNQIGGEESLDFTGKEDQNLMFSFMPPIMPAELPSSAKGRIALLSLNDPYKPPIYTQATADTTISELKQRFDNSSLVFFYPGRGSLSDNVTIGKLIGNIEPDGEKLYYK